MTATDLELGIRCSCPAKVARQGAGTIPARKLLDYVRLLPDSDIQVKFGDNQWANLSVRPFADAHRGMSRESFPELPQMPELLAEIPMRGLSADDPEDDLRDLCRGVAIHAEWRFAPAEQPMG